MTPLGPAREFQRGRTASWAPLVAGVVLLGAVIAWEARRPSLATPFELPLGRALAEGGLASPALALVVPARGLFGPLGGGTWSARLAAGGWALLATIALHQFVARLTGERRRHAVASVLVLATIPAWFLHERLFAEPIVAMASFALVLSCFGLAVLDRSLALPTRVALGSAASVAGAIGATSGGLLFVGVVPMVAILLGDTMRPTERSAPARAKLASIALLVVASVFVAFVLGSKAPGSTLANYLLGPGSIVDRSALFDAPLVRAAHALSPWTPMVFLAFARRPERPAELALLVAAAFSVLAECGRGALGRAPSFEAPIGIAAFAGAIAVALPSLDRAKRPSAMLGGTLVVVATLVANDLRLESGAVLRVFGVPIDVGAGFHPESSAREIGRAAIVIAGAWAAAFFVPNRWLPIRRSTLVLAAGVLGGCILRFHTYPRMLARLSPSELFDAWNEHRRPDEPLAVSKNDARSFAFASGNRARIVSVDDSRAGIEWLLGATNERRFFALPAEGLPTANATYRAAHRRNLPILAGQENLSLLAVNRLLPGEESSNPLDRVVLETSPTGLHPLDANLDGRLTVIGWELTDDRGRRVDVARGPVHLRFVLRVEKDDPTHAPLEGHCSFVHVDHTPSRYAAEHRSLHYPARLWREGDLVVDDFVVTLPAHFHSGAYPLFYGFGVLPCEGDRRLPVVSGPKDAHDRVRAGELQVR